MYSTLRAGLRPFKFVPDSSGTWMGVDWLLDAGRYGLPRLWLENLLFQTFSTTYVPVGVLLRSTSCLLAVVSSRDISHILWVVFTSMTVKTLDQSFLRCVSVDYSYNEKVHLNFLPKVSQMF